MQGWWNICWHCGKRLTVSPSWKSCYENIILYKQQMGGLINLFLIKTFLWGWEFQQWYIETCRQTEQVESKPLILVSMIVGSLSTRSTDRPLVSQMGNSSTISAVAASKKLNCMCISRFVCELANKCQSLVKNWKCDWHVVVKNRAPDFELHLALQGQPSLWPASHLEGLKRYQSAIKDDVILFIAIFVIPTTFPNYNEVHDKDGLCVIHVLLSY